jgi:glycosyltransferase involved in cell wall biosynthesis
VPSLNRPQNLKALVENIHETTPEEHFIVFCVSDAESMDILDELEEWYLDDSPDEDQRYVTRMNKLIEHLEDAVTVFFGSDDVIHHQGWLSKALAVMNTGPSVVVVNDLHNVNGTQAVVKREYLSRAVIDQPGLAFHSGYIHNFADNEMFLTAARQGECARAMDSVVEHLHPVFGSDNALPWDTTYTNVQHGWGHDEELWKRRRELIQSVSS